VDLLAFDRARVDVLRISLGAALENLQLIRSDEVAAGETMRSIRSACRTFTESCLPRIRDVLSSDAMTWYRGSTAGGIDAAMSRYSTAHDRSWETTTDPLMGPEYIPHGCRTFGQVLSAISSGAMIPMSSPVDAQGRAGEVYTSLTFAPGAPPLPVGSEDLTSNLAKVLDFFSDGSPIGWREHEQLTIYYLPDARVTSAVHVLTAYDRHQGPETLLDRTTEATVSGYMVIREESSRAELNVGIGPGDQDPTQSFVAIAASSSGFSGMFFPDEPPDFEPVPAGDRYVSTDKWTFTRSASPMVDGWGTWRL
jgi:hypothetical protein